MCSCGRRRAQEDAFGLEELIATGEAEQGSERVSGGQEGNHKDGQDCLAQLELGGILDVEARQDEVAARVLASVPGLERKGQARLTLPRSSMMPSVL
jgi:hypothetical protein